MSNVSFAGVGTGIDWSMIIQHEIESYRRRYVRPLENWNQTWTSQISALGEVSSKMSDLRSAADAISTPSDLKIMSASSSDDSKVEATATASASPGAYDVEVAQLASSAVIVHDGHESADAVVNDSGGTKSLVINYGEEQFSVFVHDGATLAELAGLINNSQANPGVYASVLDDGSGGDHSHHLVFTGSDTGASYAITVDEENSSLEGFANDVFTVTRNAQDAMVRVNGYPAEGWIRRETNTLSDVIAGLNLTLKKSTEGSTVSIYVGEDMDDVKKKITELVNSYNAVRTLLNRKTAYVPESDDAGVLMGNYAAGMSKTLLSNVITGRIPGFQDGEDPFVVLGQIGIETVGRTEDRNALGTLAIDENRLEEALAENFEGVINLISANFSGASDSDHITFYSASETRTRPGHYEVEADFDEYGALVAGRIRMQGETQWRSARVENGFIVGESGNPEAGLWARAEWDGASETQSAVVRVRQGAAGALNNVVNEMLDSSDGLIPIVKNNYRDIVSNIEKRIEAEERRIEGLRQRLNQRYARLESALVRLQGFEQWSRSVGETLIGFSR